MNKDVKQATIEEQTAILWAAMKVVKKETDGDIADAIKSLIYVKLYGNTDSLKKKAEDFLQLELNLNVTEEHEKHLCDMV
jgi:hypothetical protein